MWIGCNDLGMNPLKVLVRQFREPGTFPLQAVIFMANLVGALGLEIVRGVKDVSAASVVISMERV